MKRVLASGFPPGLSAPTTSRCGCATATGRTASTTTRTSFPPRTEKYCSDTTRPPTSFAYRVYAECTPPSCRCPGRRGPRRISAPHRDARRLPAAFRDAKPRHAREARLLAQERSRGRPGANRTQATTSRRSQQARARRLSAGRRRVQRRAAGRRRPARVRTSPNTFDHTLRPRPRANANRTQVAARHQPLLHRQLPARLVLRRRLRRGGRQRADRQLRPRRRRRRQHHRRGAGLHRHQQREHVHAGRRPAAAHADVPVDQRPGDREGRIARRDRGRKQSATANSARRRSTSPATSCCARAAHGRGRPTPTAARAITNAGVAGKIAVIDRGICLFVVKVQNAQDAGAIGVVIVNNVSPGTTGHGRAADPTITIPSRVGLAGRRQRDQGRTRARRA